MATDLIQHISLVSDNPLDAVLNGRNTKAYLVAELAFVEGVEAAGEHYRANLGVIYAAMSFYEDNRQAIEAAKAKAWEQIKEDGIDGRKQLEIFKKRMNQTDTTKSG